MGEEIAILYCGTHGLLKDVPLERVGEFESRFLSELRAAHEETVIKPLEKGMIDANIEETITYLADTVSRQFVQE
jgi:F-type H+-transporting ATPase subunit alpha